MNHPISPGQARVNLIALWTGCFLAASSFSLVMPFLPRYIASLGVTENLYTWSGFTYGVTFLTSSIMSPIWGNLADRYGRKPMVIRSGIAIATVYLFMSLVTHPLQLFFLRMLNGALAGFIPSAVALIATNTPEENVGRSLAVLQTGMAAGTIIGPLLGGTLADLIGIRTTMRVSSVLIAFGTLLVFVTVRERIIGAGRARTSVVQDLRTALSHRTLLALMVAAALINSSIQSLEPILTAFVPTLRFEGAITALSQALFRRGDADNFVAGFIFALPAIGTVLAAPRWARVGEKIGFARLMAIGLVGAGLLVLPQSLVQTAGALILLRFLYGLLTAAVQPSINATLASVVHPSFRGRAYGINTSAVMIGGVMGPALGGAIGDAFGPRAVFLFTGLMLLTASVWVHRRLVNRDPGEPLVGAP